MFENTDPACQANVFVNSSHPHLFNPQRIKNTVSLLILFLEPVLSRTHVRKQNRAVCVHVQLSSCCSGGLAMYGAYTADILEGLTEDHQVV